MADVPDSLRRDVIGEVYGRADSLDWDTLSHPERSSWYDRWVDDAKIGGVLTRFVSRERARVWLKDVPMKHYARARAGVGPYADLVRRRLPGPDRVAAQVFGTDWEIVEGTIRDKPNRCLVADGHDERLMIWGPVSNLRALIWAGVNAVIDGEPRPSIVITTLQGRPLDEGTRSRNVALGAHIGAEVFHTTLRPTLVPASPPVGAADA